MIKLYGKAIPTDKAPYSTHINCETAIDCVSETILEMLSNVSPRLDRTLYSFTGSTHDPSRGYRRIQGMQLTIKRVKKHDLHVPVEYELTIQRFNGPKKPELPTIATFKPVLPLNVLVQKYMSTRRADETDFVFLQDVLTKHGRPEFSGYNTSIRHDQGHTPKPKTKAVSTPLIDMTPYDPVTMTTALARAQQLTHETGQEFMVFTCDLKLYRVALHVIWAYSDMFPIIIMQLGGIHSLMSCVGSIGTLVAESGLAEVMSAVFGVVPKMLTGKKFPQNVRVVLNGYRGDTKTGNAKYPSFMQRRGNESAGRPGW